MNIPNRLKIEGIEFKVLMVTNEEMNSIVGNKAAEEGGTVCGYTSFEECKILINNSYCRAQQEVTLLHEITHICDSRMNPLSEQQIDDFARRLNAVFKDNKTLFSKS